MGRSAKSLSESATRRQRALALHLQGATYQQIGDALGFTAAAAHAAVKKALAERQGPSPQGTAEAFAVEAARLDVVIAALTRQVRQGDVLAIDRYMKAIARRTELAGLIESAAPEPVQAEVRTPLDELRQRRASRGAKPARAGGAEMADQ